MTGCAPPGLHSFPQIFFWGKKTFCSITFRFWTWLWRVLRSYLLLQFREIFLIYVYEFFLLHLLDFLFQETNSLFHRLCHHISFESLRWCFSIFFASTEIISHLYSVSYSIFSHVYFVLSCSDLFITAVLVSFDSKSVSLVLQPFLLIYYLVFELVLLDSYWRIGSLRQPRRSPSWIMFSHRLSSWGGPGTQGPPTRQDGQCW